jgi:hypothetical protein
MSMNIYIHNDVSVSDVSAAHFHSESMCMARPRSQSETHRSHLRWRGALGTSALALWLCPRSRRGRWSVDNAWEDFCWGFQQWGYPIAGWFTMEIPFTRMIRGYPYFRKPPYWGFCAETNIGLHFGDKNWRKYDRKNWQFYRDPTGRTCWWFSFRYPLVI